MVAKWILTLSISLRRCVRPTIRAFLTSIPDMLRCRKSRVLTRLPDGYGRGRIIGDYRRVALYGIRYLVRERELQFADLQPALERGEALEATLRLREELAEQRRALLQMQEMAARYGCDIAHLARTAWRRCSGSTSPTWRR